MVGSQFVDFRVLVAQSVKLLAHLSPKSRSMGSQLFSDVGSVVARVGHDLCENSAALWIVGPSPHQ